MEKNETMTETDELTDPRAVVLFAALAGSLAFTGVLITMTARPIIKIMLKEP